MVWLSLLREILGNMCIVVVCQTGCDVKYFKLVLPLLLSRLFGRFLSSLLIFFKNLNIFRTFNELLR